MFYTIQKGDTLSRLAKKYNTSVDELTRRNKIANPNKIYAGATLDIPDAQGEGAAVFTPAEGARGNGSTFGGALPQSAPDFSYTPEAYQSAYADEIEALLKNLNSRESFSYDYSEDPVYENYKNSYTNGGRLAMQDSMGEAAALTGGYGSSYAQSVGQQTYQAYMRALSDKVPELAENAYDRYKDEEKALLSQLEGYNELDAAAYARYRDAAEDEQSRREIAYRQYRDEQEDALERYKLERAAQEEEREWAYRLAQDEEKSAGGAKSGSSKASSDAGNGASGEAQAIYALFEGMTARERKVIFSDLPSIEYMRDILGEEGFAKIKRKYGVG